MTEAQNNNPTTLFEGIISFRAVCNAQGSGFNDRRILKTYYSSEKLKRSAHEFSYVKAKSHELGFEIEIVSNEELRSLCSGTTHGGIAFLCSDRTEKGISDIRLPEKGFYIMLDGIEDPFNFGYAVRSVFASGADGIILPERNWMSAAGTVCKSSAGTSELIPSFVIHDEKELSVFKRSGYSILATDTDNSISVYEADLSYPLLLIIGGEKRGISAKVMAYADKTVRIDYGRDFGAALSAASASAILSFEVLRYNRFKNN